MRRILQSATVYLLWTSTAFLPNTNQLQMMIMIDIYRGILLCNILDYIAMDGQVQPKTQGT